MTDLVEEVNSNLHHVSYDFYKDFTRTGIMQLSIKMMRLVIRTYFDKIEHESIYTVTNPKGILKFYAEIGCSIDSSELKIKTALGERFPQPGLVKDFIDANKIAYKYSQKSKGIKRKGI